jgi:hypothetical protein
MQSVYFTPIIRAGVVGGQGAGAAGADDNQFAKSCG